MKALIINKYDQVTLLFILMKISMHLLTNSNYELHRDELLYFNMAGHLSFGYATVPPMTAFVAFIAKMLFGYSVSGIRLFPALAGAMTILIMAKIIKKMGAGIPALIIASVSFLLSPGFLLFDTLLTPNVFEHLLWLLVLWFLLRMITEDRPALWIPTGIILGIAFMFKYSVLFLMAGLFIAFMAGQYRKFLNTRYFLSAILAGVLIVTPNLMWQYLHNWPVVNHMEELSSTQLTGMTPALFLTDLLSLNLASTVVWVTGLVSLLFLRDERRYRFFGIASLGIILLFIMLNGKGYYALGIIPFLFAAGGYAMEKYLKGKLIILRNTVMVLVIAVSLPALPTGLPLLSFDKYMEYRERTGFLRIYPFFRWEDGEIHKLSQVYADMTGWSELAGYTATAYYMLPADQRESCTIYAESNYGYAGAINFYGREHDLPEAVTFHESYIFWAPDTIPDGPVIYLSPEINGMHDLFEDVTEVGTVHDPYFREAGLKVYLCKDPFTDVQEVYRMRSATEKDNYR